MLSLEGVRAGYGPLNILNDVSLDVMQGEVITLLGNNGAGKTTTLRAITGLLPVKKGRVTLEGQDISHLKPHEIVRRGISCVPEGRKIFSKLTVTENLIMGAYLNSNRQATQDTMDRVFQIFPVLRERKRQMGGSLSGGEQQMLAIGRGLMAKPKVLLLDEPSMGLAPKLVELIFQIVKEINRGGATILLVEQNARMALSIAHRGYVMESGTIRALGRAEDLSGDEGIKRAYLGTAD
ncbi:MAG: ABC transporter ATP-binding protein [Bacillota bacterium]